MCFDRTEAQKGMVYRTGGAGRENKLGSDRVPPGSLLPGLLRSPLATIKHLPGLKTRYDHFFQPPVKVDAAQVERSETPGKQYIHFGSPKCFLNRVLHQTVP